MPTDPRAGQVDRPAEKFAAMSPFDNVAHAPEVALPVHRPFSWKLVVAGGLSFILTLAVAVLAVLLWKSTVDNPLRTLEFFSADKYFENPHALIGNQFQATLKVEGDLGWTPGVGKLMVFSVEGDSRYVPVLIKGDNLSYSFNKGQTYIAQIKIEEGGLISATDLKKK